MLSYISSLLKPQFDERMVRKNAILKKLSIECTDIHYFPKDCFECCFLGLCTCKAEKNLIDHKFVDDYKKFYKYCHYPNLHQNQDDIRLILSNSPLLAQCLARQETHCPVASILLSKSEFEEKKRIVNILLSYGFQISKDCIIIIELILKKKILAKNVSLFMFYDFLPEIKNIILNKLAQLYRWQYIPI